MSLRVFQANHEPQKLIVVVGLGLVGRAIAKHLRLRARTLPTKPVPVDWTDSNSLIQHLQQAVLERQPTAIELVWAAGNAGFGATQAEMDAELEFYKAVVRYLKSKLQLHITVNLISSAGGLYEGAARVEHIDDIAPVRPYAFSKLQQEEFLAAEGINHRIYRASSVYGHGGSRMGLIQALINSTIERKPMDIYANQNTLRDYIYNQDLGVRIVSDVLSGATDRVSILASGRPTSIAMLLKAIERVAGRPLAASFRVHTENTQDIVFAPSLLRYKAPKTSLEEGVRLLYKKRIGGVPV